MIILALSAGCGSCHGGTGRHAPAARLPASGWEFGRSVVSASGIVLLEGTWALFESLLHTSSPARLTTIMNRGPFTGPWPGAEAVTFTRNVADFWSGRQTLPVPRPPPQNTGEVTNEKQIPRNYHGISQSRIQTCYFSNKFHERFLRHDTPFRLFGKDF